MPRPTGRPPKPIEEKILTGNPGKRRLPERGSLTVLPAAAATPEPDRPLMRAGRELWNRIWTSPAVSWLSVDVDIEHVLIVCEQMDERAGLRLRVLKDNDWRDRAALRALDAQIVTGLALLGLNPVDRARLGVAEVKRASAVEGFLAARQARNSR